MAEASGRFSSAFAAVPWTALPPVIQEALTELSRSVGGHELLPLRWNDGHVVVAIDVPVDLPSRGPVADLDIRAVEPILIRFSTEDYPAAAPGAYSDRHDFPAARLPHLNPTSKGQPFSLCLHRGNLNDWFAEHSIADYVERVRAWLRDAAADRLMRDGDHFEHTRLTEYEGVAVFDSAALERTVRARWATSPLKGAAYFHARLTGSARETAGLSRYAVRVSYVVGDTPPEEHLKLVRDWNGFSAEARDHEWWATGLLLWPDQTPRSTYFGHVPSTYGELVEFCTELGLPLEAGLDDYLGRGAKQCWCIPVTVAVPRPRPLIGTSSNVEWLSFLLIAEGEDWTEQGKPRPELPVSVLGHRQPLLPAFAANLSRREEAVSALERPMILGVGALGSKVALHFAKSGIVAQSLVDHSMLTPHHLVRHGLAARHIGKNKAEAMRDEIMDLYSRDSSVAPEAHAGSVLSILRRAEVIRQRTLFIDATASTSVLGAVVDATLPAPALRLEIADQGRLGILTCEGPERNPRLDDLQAHLWSLATTDDSIADWLARHREETADTRGPVLEEIGIGLGCSSATMRLGDDVVAYHASQLTMGVRRIAGDRRRDGGWIQLSRLADDEALAGRRFSVPSIRILQPRNGRSWSVRMSSAVDADIRKELHRAGRRETGGLLLGYLHAKRKVAYVTSFLRESSDSVGTPDAFKRGSLGYADQVRVLEQRTGGLLGYIGEWHTHPNGKPEPSRKDRDTMRTTRSVLAPVGMPTIVVIAAPSGTKAFVDE